ncbi:MAG: ABC transporter permease [Eubacteriales bacterium]|nr:ABC transporter permease [Eubacteriales bacterium]
MSSNKITKKMISQMSRQSLKSSRMRNIFVMITIVLASALLTAILMYTAGQQEYTKRQLSHMQQVGYFNLSEGQAEALEADERIAYQIQVKTGTPSEMDGFEVIPFYVDEMSDKIQIGELESGTLPEGENEIAVQGAMLEKMGIAPEIGTQVTLDFYDENTETFTVAGILKGGEAAKRFSVFFSRSYAENGSQLKDSPYEVYAKLYGAATMHPEECKEAMYLIGSDAGIERKYINPSKPFLDSLSINMQDVLIFGLVGVVILLACILVIYGVFYLSVIGKIHQFGQLCTIGMTKKQMKKLVSKEGRRLFLYASPIGILIGGVAGYFIIPSGFDLGNTLLIAACVFTIICLITMISVHKPAKLAALVSPMEALRYVPQDDMEKTANKKMCRSLTPFGLGVMNFSKNKKKSVITMLSLAFGGILFMVAATYISSFDKANYSRQSHFTHAEFDIFYSQSAIELNENGMSELQSKVPLDSQMIQEIIAIDGVEGVEQLKNFGIIYDFPKLDEFNNKDTIYPLNDEETKTIGNYIEDGSADYDKLMSGDYVLVTGNSNVMEIYGWQFHVGDVLTFHYYDGTQMAEKEVTILGILNDQYTLDNDHLEGWFLMPEQVILNLVSYDSLNSNLLVSTDPEKEAAVGEVLSQMVDERMELGMQTLADRKIADAHTVNTLFGAISGLAIFIMTFSVLSMMNTLITNIVTRKQELAMLESIGMAKAQIRKMLLGESLFLVLMTVGTTMTIGTMCGYVLSKMLYNRGAFYMAFKFPTVFALVYAAVLIAIPLIIILVSMKSFSKEALVERLRGVEC